MPWEEAMMPFKKIAKESPQAISFQNTYKNGFKPYHHWEVLQEPWSKSLAGSVSNGSQSALPVPLFFFGGAP